ncbi:MAG: hypothetical protein ABSF87_17605 [Xanthobacteraceae bacterium]|jgi:hypothetical protein
MTPRTYQRHDLDDNHAYDENGILKDGHALRVPLRMMDAMQKDAHEHFSRAKVTDGAGDSDLGLHRPGFRISNTITRDRSVYAAYDAAAEVAYKNVGRVESEVRGQREGDSRTAKSDQGRDASADSKLNDAMRDEREAAHQEYQDRIQNAWKDGR